MTQWSGGAGGPQQYPPPGQYPPAQYGPSQYGPPQYGAQQYGPSPYGPGAKAPRETGAQLACIVLLVAAIIGSIVAGHVIGGSSSESASSPAAAATPQPGAGAASQHSADPAASRATIKQDFPVYPGARQVHGVTHFLAQGQIDGTSGKGTYFLASRSVNSVYRWYGKHLARDHLHWVSVARTVYRGTDILAWEFGGVSNPTSTVTGELNLQPGRADHTCVVSVYFYG